MVYFSLNESYERRQTAFMLQAVTQRRPPHILTAAACAYLEPRHERAEVFERANSSERA